MANARFKDSESLPISIRHIANNLKVTINYSIVKNLLEVETKEGSKSRELFDEIFTEHVEKMKNIQKTIAQTGTVTGLDEMTVNRLLKAKDSELSDILYNIFDAMRNMPREDFVNPIDDEEKLRAVKDKVVELSGQSMLEQVDLSGKNRNERLNNLLNTNTLSQWASVFRRQDDWTYKAIYADNEPEVKTRAMVFHELNKPTDVSYDRKYDDSVEESLVVIEENLLGDMITTINKSCIKNEGSALLQRKAEDVVRYGSERNFLKRIENTFNEVGADY